METPEQQTEVKKEGRRLFNYKWIVKNVPFFLFLSVLAVVYIYNGHYATKTIRSVNKLTKEVKDLESEYKTLKSDVLFQSKQSEMAKAVQSLGLKELTAPPMVLKDSIAP